MHSIRLSTAFVMYFLSNFCLAVVIASYTHNRYNWTQFRMTGAHTNLDFIVKSTDCVHFVSSFSHGNSPYNACHERKIVTALRESKWCMRNTNLFEPQKKKQYATHKRSARVHITFSMCGSDKRRWWIERSLTKKSSGCIRRTRAVA